MLDSESIVPVILAGGAGTRLWPLSREMYPKQFLKLFGDETMLQATLRRARAITSRQPIIVTHYDHRFIVSEQLAEKDFGSAQLLLEPEGRNTAIAIACAAHAALASNPDAVLLVLAADHVIQDDEALKQAAHAAVKAAACGRLVTFGVEPRFASTAYGYIAQGEAMPGAAGCFEVKSFVEKPDADRAGQYWQQDGWLWNSGMFLMRADCYLRELEKHDPKIAANAKQAMADAKTESLGIRLDAASYANSPGRSIDHAVMEHTAQAGVVPCDIGWSDIGSWSALWDIGAKDKDHNVVLGDVIMHETENCYIRSEGPLVVTYGLQDAVVVVMPDVVMVSSRHQPQGIKFVIDQLRARQRTELTTPRRIHRPWGSYEVIVESADFKVKKIIVKPGARLSLQRHKHRSEHWVVVSGIANIEITDADSEVKLKRGPNTSAYIPCGAIHRLTNAGQELLEVIEVQCGDYLGEDDIERLSDDHERPVFDAA